MCSPEINSNKFIVLDNRSEQVIRHVLDGGRVALVDEPGEDGGLVGQAARVEVGYTVLVVDQHRALLHAQPRKQLLISHLEAEQDK